MSPTSRIVLQGVLTGMAVHLLLGTLAGVECAPRPQVAACLRLRLAWRPCVRGAVRKINDKITRSVRQRTGATATT